MVVDDHDISKHLYPSVFAAVLKLEDEEQQEEIQDLTNKNH